MNIFLALLIFLVIIVIHEFGHFIVAKLCGVGVIEFAIGMGPKVISKKIGETIYSLRLIPFGGFCSMVGEDTNEDEEWEKEKSFANKKLWQKFLITFAGPMFNFILAFLCAIIYITAFGSPKPALINGVIEDSPAMEAGLEIGDIIIEINGRDIDSFNDVTAYNITHGGETFNVKIDRNGEIKTIKITPKYNEELQYYTMGIMIDSTYKTSDRTFGEIITSSCNEIRYWVRMVFDSFRMIGKGTAKVEDMTGVVGVVDLVGDSVETASEYGVSNVISICLYMLIFLSINIGIMNLLPLPALDGGRCLMYIGEGITRKSLPRKIENGINTIGLVALMILMVVVTFNDIIRIFS